MSVYLPEVNPDGFEVQHLLLSTAQKHISTLNW